MCLSCGCDLPSEKHGDVRHFTYPDLVAAADAAKIKPKKAVKNIVKTFKHAQKARKADDAKAITPDVAPVVPDAA